MSQELKQPILIRAIAAGAVVALAAFVLAGCGSSSQPISKETSKYKAADSTSGAGKTTAASDATDKTAVAKNGKSQSGNAGQGTGSKSGNGAGGNDAEGSPPTQPPAIPSEQLATYRVPDGTPEELLAFIEQLDERQPRGQTREEMITDFQNIQQAKIGAAEKLLQMKTTDENRTEAVHVKLESLRILAEVGVPGVEQHIREFSAVLKQDESPKLARLGRLILFGMQVGDVASGKIEDPKPIMEELKAILADSELGEDTFGASQQAAMVLHSAGHTQLAGEALKLIGTAFKDSKDPQLADAAQQLLETADLVAADFQNKLQEALEDTPGAMEQLMDVIRKLLGAQRPGRAVYETIAQAAQYLEFTQHYGESAEIFTLVAEKYKDHPDKELAQEAMTAVANGSRRVGLIGKPFTVEGVTLDGLPFDWNKYKGKVVLIDFWATWCGPCIREIPNILDNYEAYHDKGFEVVGINLDDDRPKVDQFFATKKLPWETVLSADPEASGFNNPLAVKCGIEAIPFIVIVDREGNAAALHVRGPALDKKLAEMLGPAEPKPTREAPKDKAPPADGAANESPQSIDIDTPAATFFVTLNNADDNTAADESEANPYLPRPGLSPAELAEFILNMQEKPKSIQARPGFAEAIVVAADQILAAETKDSFHFIAAEAKFDVLHKKACLGDQQAEKSLTEFVTQLKDDSRQRIAKQVRFFTLERQTIDCDNLPLEKIPDLLTELKTFFSQEKLEARHLRIASSTVHAINRLEDVEQREKLFAEFGGVFAKSTDKQLAAYGKKLAKPAEGVASDLVGKPLELAGVTAAGTALDWKSYRGKVVLVDFWATWCGPCIREMPNVKALYEKHCERGFDVVGVSLDKDLEALAKFLEENAVPWATLSGEETEPLAAKYGVRGIPTMMLVDKDGKVVAVSHKVADLVAKAEKLLGASPETPAKSPAAE
jgi:thiol-disulfide isomerase/thioredoxin